MWIHDSCVLNNVIPRFPSNVLKSRSYENNVMFLAAKMVVLLKFRFAWFDSRKVLFFDRL